MIKVQMDLYGTKVTILEKLNEIKIRNTREVTILGDLSKVEAQISEKFEVTKDIVFHQALRTWKRKCSRMDEQIILAQDYEDLCI
ncbi:hypothetical protein FQA39_LY05635 [Lamprigera yunnana]|nr:hypothetical protein FQA39_LY05635 [Lamprigera yunnana]